MSEDSGTEPALKSALGSWTLTPSSSAQGMGDEETATRVLRIGGSVAILFLAIYLVYGLWHGAGDKSLALLHWITVLGAMGFFAVTWTRGFRRYWKLWNLLFCITLIVILIVISADTHQGDSRFIAVLLFPVATASLVNWGWRWQALMGASCLVLYAAAEFFLPTSEGSLNRWLGVLAAVALAQCTSFFIGHYRERLAAQVQELMQAAVFRETQIATMAHDIRSPVAAIAGFVDLLEDKDLSDDDRTEVLARIASTAWSMDLTVSNVLDVYQISSGKVAIAPMRLDPNRIVADAASSCATQAEHKGLKLSANYGAVARGNFDPRHLERIARNMLAYSISRLSTGEIRLRTRPSGNGIAIEVEDDGPAPADDELASLLMRFENDGNRASKVTLGIYVARALAERAGGRVKISLPTDNSLKLIAEIPSAKIEAKARPSSNS